MGCAISSHPCGFDLQVHVDKDILGIAETFFCESEYEMLHQLAPEKRMAQFFDHYLLGEPMPEWMEKGIPALEKETNMGYEAVDKH